MVEERRFERLGGTRTLEVDVRFVAASSVDLRQAVAAGTFREDLYHRLSVVPLTLPPLRERREDILPLAEPFLARERAAQDDPAARAFARETADALRGYPWPGNVRELRSVVERAALYATGEVGGLRRAAAAHPGAAVDAVGGARPPALAARTSSRSTSATCWSRWRASQTRAAAILGISRKALWEKRRRYGIP